MHFSIPDTEELISASTTYTGYNIYINGSFHCCLRYKQLHGLHEQLQRRCCESQLPDFPPKRLLPLTNNQLETRRAALEQYLQLIGQDIHISKLDYFQNFLLNAQLETALRYSENGGREKLQRDTLVHLDVSLMSGYQLRVKDVQIGSNSSTLLRQTCDLLRLPKQLMPYFCLFLGRKEPKNTLVLMRLLMDFESPYLSRYQAHPCQIFLRKCYWDPSYDLHLMQDTIALNLLYIQTIADIEREWIITTSEVCQKLQSLQDHGLKKEYLELARHLPLYGCLQFVEASVDYPEPLTRALISIGNKELSMRTIKGQKIYETKFRVTRMRCWRVTTLHNTQQIESTNGANQRTTIMPPTSASTARSITTSTTNLQLAFEYLMSKQSLRWITIKSSQAMLMSFCLQSMVDELLSSKESNNSSTTKINKDSTSNYGRIIHSQSTQSSALSSSSSLTPSFSNEPLSSTSTSTNSSTSSSSSPTAPVRFIAQQQRRAKQNPKILTAASYAAVFFRNAQEESMQNEAFEGIGDDDL